MNTVARRMAVESTEAAFLSACTTTPISNEVLFAVRRITTLLESALVSGETFELREALVDYDTRTSCGIEIFSSAVQALSESRSTSLADLGALVHGAGRIERIIFDEFPVSHTGAAPLAFVM
jgi:hypothetical protein